VTSDGGGTASKSAARRRAAAVGAAALAGVGLAVQARLNGQLGARLGDGIAASLASTVCGVVLLFAVVLGTRSGRRGLRRIHAAFKVGQLRWWHCCGGMTGAVVVASQGISAAALGVGVFTVAVVGGTSAGSLAIDRWGLGPGGRRPITTARVAGAVACVAAVGLASHDRFGNSATLALVVLPVLAGVAVATQAALNGRVGVAAGSPLAATLVSFVFAGLTLCLALLGDMALRGVPAGHLPTEPWLYGGGIVGICAIAVATVVVRHVGVLVFGLASVAGQLLGALALDALASGSPPPATTWIAVAITLGAVALAVWPARRAASAALPEHDADLRGPASSR
jgi:bacterial/archaeal transporter family-2 protein